MYVQGVSDRPYRLRMAGHSFLLAATGVVALPASRAAAGLLVGLCVVTLLARPVVRIVAVNAGIGAAAAVGLYTARSQGNAAVAVAAGLLCGLVALTACSGRVDRRLVEVRAFAFAEIFVYASAAGLLLGLTASNENRRFLISTVGTDRYSFAFAASPSQAAMMAGVGVVLAAMTTIDVPHTRRFGLGAVSLVLVWGANYRFVVAVVLAVLAVAWYRSKSRPLVVSRRRGSRTLAYGSIAVAVLPLWWPSASRLAAEPLASIFAAAPAGFGSRSSTLDDIEEARTLNRRTEIWTATISLLGRSTTSELAFGHGAQGGDYAHQSVLNAVVGASFDRLDTISAHNSWLEQIRRGGLVLGGGCVAAVLWLFVRSRHVLTPGCFAGGAVLIASGGADISVLPSAIVTTAMFLTLCMPLRVPPHPNGRGDLHPVGAIADELDHVGLVRGGVGSP